MSDTITLSLAVEELIAYDKSTGCALYWRGCRETLEDSIVWTWYDKVSNIPHQRICGPRALMPEYDYNPDKIDPRIYKATASFTFTCIADKWQLTQRTWPCNPAQEMPIFILGGMSGRDYSGMTDVSFAQIKVDYANDYYLVDRELLGDRAWSGDGLTTHSAGVYMFNLPDQHLTIEGEMKRARECAERETTT